MNNSGNYLGDVLKILSEKAPPSEKPTGIKYNRKEKCYSLPANDPRHNTVEEIDILLQAKWSKGSPEFHKIDVLYVYANCFFSTICSFLLKHIKPPDRVPESLDEVVAKSYVKSELREYFELCWLERQLYSILKDIFKPDVLPYLSAPNIKELPENLGMTCFNTAGRSALDAAIKFSSHICFFISPFNNLAALRKDILKLKITPLDPKLWHWYWNFPELIRNILPSSDWPNWKIQRETDRLICFIDDEYSNARKLCLGENSAMPEILPHLNVSKEALALAIKVQYPDWTDAKIAEAISIHPKSLYRMPMFKAIKAAHKGNRNKIPKGEKSKNGNIEAWND